MLWLELCCSLKKENKNEGALMKIDYLIYGVLAVVVIGLAYTVWDMIEMPDKKESKVLGTVSTGDTETGNVQIDLTPVGIVNGKLAINVAANTHSVSLDDYDLAEITTLVYNGKGYKPVSAVELESHHGSGNIIFDINEIPKNFKVIIKGIPNIEERVFEWR